MGNLLGIKQSLNALISCDNRACENREHNGHAGQVLDSSIAEGKASARLLASKPERHGKRDRGRSVSEIVNRIREKRDAAGNKHDNELKRRGGSEADERPFDRPQPATA